MIYNNFNLQPLIWSRLQQLIIKNTIPNALIFYGDEGSGKEGYAIELAAALNCKDNNGVPCGNCQSCRKIISFQHGNIRLIIPYPRGKISSKDDPSIRGLSNREIDNLYTMMKAKGQNPFFNIKIDKAQSILINSIRELKKDLYMSTIEDGYTVILIFNSEKLCIPQPTSGNALLKLLEEPPNKTLFILVTSNMSSIIGTIRSRCQQIYFPPIESSKIIPYFEKNNLSEEKKILISCISDGNMKLAFELIENVDELFQNLKSLIKSTFLPNSEIWQMLIEKIIILNRTENKKMNYFFRTIILYFRDLMVYSNTKNKNDLIYVNLIEHYDKIISSYNKGKWNQCIDIVEEIYNNIERNGYVPLHSTNMMLEIQHAIKGE